MEIKNNRGRLSSGMIGAIASGIMAAKIYYAIDRGQITGAAENTNDSAIFWLFVCGYSAFLIFSLSYTVYCFVQLFRNK